MRYSYVVPIRWMVIYGYEVPGEALNLNSTNYPDHGHYGDPPLQFKIYPDEISHSIIKYPQYKFTLMHMALLSPRTSP
jgi:hypothetical protein